VKSTPEARDPSSIKIFDHLRPPDWPPSRSHLFGKNVSTVSISLEETQTGPSYGDRRRRCSTRLEKVETHFGEETEESQVQGRTLDWTWHEFQLQGGVSDDHLYPQCLYPPDICDGTTERRSGNVGWNAHEVRVLVKQFSNPHIHVSDLVSSPERRYVPALRGILVAHSNVKFLGTVAIIKADCPFANCRVSFDATVWSPLIGMKLCECLVATFSAGSSGVFLAYNTRSGEGQSLFARSRIPPRSQRIQCFNTTTSHTFRKLGVRIWTGGERSGGCG